jgi:hypothetical protein
LPPSAGLYHSIYNGPLYSNFFDEQLLLGVYDPTLKAEIMPKHSGSRKFIISRISAAGYPKFSQDTQNTESKSPANLSNP